MEYKDVPFHVHEGIVDRLDRINRRLIAVVILLVFLLFATNLGWVIYENQFEDVVTTTETEVDAIQWGGSTNIVSGGDVNYGTGYEDKD